MKFKYILDYERLIGVNKQAECAICATSSLCYHNMCRICYDKQNGLKATPKEFQNLYVVARPKEIRTQLTSIYPNLSSQEIEELARERDNEIEHGTPPLNAYQGFQWPCLDGDYCEFIAYGSKPFYKEWFKDKGGKEVFFASLHPEIKEYYTEDDYWDDYVPDESICSSKETNYATLFFVFKSLHSNEIITYVDSM